jgi:sugar-specific transcriptional regulator TrmB
LIAEEDIEILTHLGLSHSQASVYSTLSQFGVSDAKILWKNSKVGRQDIYRILLELQKKGLVEKVISKPSKYQAIPLTEAISLLLEQKKNELTRLQSEAIKLVEIKSRSLEDSYPDKYEYIMIPKEILDLRISQTFSRTEKSIDICLNARKLSDALLKTKYTEAVKKGINVRVIVNQEHKDCPVKLPFAAAPNFQIRYIVPIVPAAFGVFDERELYLSNNAEARFLGADCLWSNYPSIVKSLQSYFELQWRTAHEKLQAKKARKPRFQPADWASQVIENQKRATLI